ncbi:MAG: hypothetical protein JOZ47_17325 [Kutzneria sp.]|nr:hypothetical protein [Kutzneria sp.]MBV9846806.1 hypothetical protein [Kutzneria sp.]
MAGRRLGFLLVAILLLAIEPTFVGDTAPVAGPLRVSDQNSRYFATPAGQPILLTGSHTWQNFQDTGEGDSPPRFDYSAYLTFLRRNNHNFFRLWVWEQARWSNEIDDDDYVYTPSPYQRAGPGTAVDGQPKFNLDRFDPAYFARLRDRVRQAGQQGVYVSVMLFDGWSIQACKGDVCLRNPWNGHPFNKDNNVNGVDGDPNGDGSGEETQTLAVPAVTARQEAYVRKVIDTVGDLDNVLYEITNEGPSDSVSWQYHMINYIKSYESAQGKEHHPVGMTAAYPGGDNAALVASPADWISPNGDMNNPQVNTGTKVVLSDTDHLCGVCADSSWPWKSFTRGQNPIYMDAYDGAYGIGGHMDDPAAVSVRANLGYVLAYSRRMNLAAVTPQPDLSSTGYCLAGGGEYLVFSPGGTFTVNLTGMSRLYGQWLDPNTGRTASARSVTGARSVEFTAPFDGPAVLYLKSS